MFHRLAVLFAFVLAPIVVHAEPQHAIAMHGEPKYGPDFAHFDYVNPGAPKGGRLKLSSLGNYDSLNQFILKGNEAAGLGLLYDSLMTSSDDEPFTEYGLVAESIDVADDRSSVSFKLREEARFNDGEPITPEDVIFSFNVLREQGHPQFRVMWADVTKVEQTGPREVTFYFRNGDNSELPLIVGQLPVLPKHYWDDKDFSQTTLQAPLGSGPYRIQSRDPGRSITYERVPDYWAKDLPVNRGKYNFDEIVYDYYTDDTVRFEAFKSGAYDLRAENVSKNWATGYEIAAVRDGRIQKVEIEHDMPQGMQAFFFNTRRAMFADPRVRQALNYAFDFEWTNKNLFYGAYTRTESYFANSELASREPPSPAELELLEPYRGQVPDDVFTQVYEAPETDGIGFSRENLRKAQALLEEAGWVLRGNRRVNAETGQPLSFEILLYDPTYGRIALPFVRNLERLGIQASVRIVEPAQYVERLKRFDYDLMLSGIGQSLSPGNEQRLYWSSAAAEQFGSRNYSGIKDPVVDALIEKVIAAKSREDLIAATRALDRVLLYGRYVIPNWHIDRHRLAYWDKFGRPEVNPPYGLPVETTWWAKSAQKGD